MKRSTMLSTAAVLALSSTLALAEGAQRQERQEPSTAPSAQQQAPSRAPQSQQPSSAQSSQPSQDQSQQPPANQSQNAQREPAPAQPNNQRAQQPAQQNNTNAQREPSQSGRQPAQNNAQIDRQQPAQNNAQTNQQPAQRSTQQGTQAPQSGQARQSGQGTNQATNQAAATTPQQRTQIATSIRQQNVAPVRVNFALNVGVAVPSSVRLSVLPDTIVSIVPQYRGYSYFVTDERIVIVEPASHHIVEVLPYEGGGRAAATTTMQRKAQFSSEQRASIRKHAVQKHTATVGAGASRRIVVDEEVPAAVELEEFSDVVVREVPAVRTYRYYREDNDVVVVDPGTRRVIDVIE